MQASIILFDGFTDLDVFLPWDILNRIKISDWNVKLLGTKHYHTSVSGLTIPTHGLVEDAFFSEAVLFASGPPTRSLMKNQEYLARFHLDPGKQKIGSMCSGALLLAALGLLSGKQATTYPTAKHLLKNFGIDVLEKPFVQQGNIATAAGCLAGELLAGWVIESLFGLENRQKALAQIQPVDTISNSYINKVANTDNTKPPQAI